MSSRVDSGIALSSSLLKRLTVALTEVEREGSGVEYLPISPPFSIRLLERATKHGGHASQCDNDQLLTLLPASYRTEHDNLAAPARDVTACVEKELDVRRLTSIRGWLWAAGRPMPPRPLHYQLQAGREIFITEQMDMHLVWTTGRIFIKPIPRFLLEPRFWTEYLSCPQRCACSVGNTASSHCTIQECERRSLWRRALGFLFTYAALISHESDFRTATERHLLPPGIEWLAWRTFVEELDTEHIYPDIDPRFHYGELRLNRLNKIYSLWQTPLRAYKSHWKQYSTFFQDNFAWLAGTTVYIIVVLTAMQVGLATKSLAGNDAFQAASYYLTVAAILGPLIAASLIVLAFCYFFVDNCIATVKHKKKRLRNIDQSLTRRNPNKVALDGSTISDAYMDLG